MGILEAGWGRGNEAPTSEGAAKKPAGRPGTPGSGVYTTRG